MRDVALSAVRVPTMTAEAIDKVRALQIADGAKPQVALETQHVLHAGLYSRTIHLPGSVRITGALIKVATLLIVQGDCWVWLGDKTRRLTGYHVLPASAGRKQAFWSIDETFITMVFPTDARDVESAERQFSDEAEALASRRGDTPNQIVVTGE